jgi:hypothetical protein
MRGDARSRRIAIVSDRILNPRPAEPDTLGRLADDGWGVVALPPSGLEDAAWEAWAAPIVDQVVTFLGDGYEVAICGPEGDETERFRAALRAAGWSIDLVLP